MFCIGFATKFHVLIHSKINKNTGINSIQLDHHDHCVNTTQEIGIGPVLIEQNGSVFSVH